VIEQNIVGNGDTFNYNISHLES